MRTEGGRVPLEALLDACDARTRIVSVSWVGYASGWRIDLDRLVEAVHARGALLFLDAIQGLGVFPLDVRRTPVDFLAADGHKWLLGPEGAGIFYLRREHLDLLRPLGVGWNSVAHDRDFTRIELNFKDTAERYEGGTMNVAGFIGLNASLELLLRHGQQAISRRVLEITDLACERLAGRRGRHRKLPRACITPAASFRSASPAATPTRCGSNCTSAAWSSVAVPGDCASALTPTTTNRTWSGWWKP